VYGRSCLKALPHRSYTAQPQPSLLTPPNFFYCRCRPARRARQPLLQGPLLMHASRAPLLSRCSRRAAPHPPPVRDPPYSRLLLPAKTFRGTITSWLARGRSDVFPGHSLFIPALGRNSLVCSLTPYPPRSPRYARTISMTFVSERDMHLQQTCLCTTLSHTTGRTDEE
jgi:hypothetical protein